MRSRSALFVLFTLTACVLPAPVDDNLVRNEDGSLKRRSDGSLILRRGWGCTSSPSGNSEACTWPRPGEPIGSTSPNAKVVRLPCGRDAVTPDGQPVAHSGIEEFVCRYDPECRLECAPPRVRPPPEPPQAPSAGAFCPIWPRLAEKRKTFIEMHHGWCDAYDIDEESRACLIRTVDQQIADYGRACASKKPGAADAVIDATIKRCGAVPRE